MKHIGSTGNSFISISHRLFGWIFGPECGPSLETSKKLCKKAVRSVAQLTIRKIDRIVVMLVVNNIFQDLGRYLRTVPGEAAAGNADSEDD